MMFGRREKYCVVPVAEPVRLEIHRETIVRNDFVQKVQLAEGFYDRARKIYDRAKQIELRSSAESIFSL